MVDALKKFRFLMNYIIIEKKRDRFCFLKNALFDILSLANQLHKLKSTYLESLKRGKIYFSENQVSNLVQLRLIHLPQVVKAYKKAIQKDTLHKTFIFKDRAENKVVNKLFRQTRENIAVTSHLTDLFK